MSVTATAKPTTINFDQSRIKASYDQIKARDLDVSSEGGLRELTNLLTGVLNQVQNEASMEAMGVKSSSEEVKSTIGQEVALLRTASQTFFGKGDSTAKDSFNAQIKQIEKTITEKKVPKPNIGAGILGNVNFGTREDAVKKLSAISDTLANNSISITGKEVSQNTFMEQGRLLMTAIKSSTQEDGTIDQEKFLETLKTNPVRIGTKFLKVAQASIQAEIKSHNPLIRASLSKVRLDKKGDPISKPIITEFFKNGAIQFPAENSIPFKKGIPSEADLKGLAVKIQSFEERTLPNLREIKKNAKTDKEKVQADKNMQAAFNKLIANLNPVQQAHLKKLVNSEGEKAEAASNPLQDVNISGIMAKATSLLVGGGLLGKFIKLPGLGVIGGMAAGLVSLLALVPPKFKAIIRKEALNFLDGHTEPGQLKDIASNLIKTQLV